MAEGDFVLVEIDATVGELSECSLLLDLGGLLGVLRESSSASIRDRVTVESAGKVIHTYSSAMIVVDWLFFVFRCCVERRRDERCSTIVVMRFGLFLERTSFAATRLIGFSSGLRQIISPTQKFRKDTSQRGFLGNLELLSWHLVGCEQYRSW